MTLLPSISPASNVTFGNEVVPPLVIVAEPAALRKPGAVATTAYVPAGAVRLKVPSGLAGTDATNVFVASYKLTVTGLVASTCPLSVPAGRGVGEATGVSVKVGVGDTSGVEVNVDVGDSTGVAVKVEVGVGDSAGVEVEVAVGLAFGSVVDVAVAVSPGTLVAVGVAVSPGTVVAVGVAVSPGTEVAVGDPSGVEVSVGFTVPTGVGVKVAVGALPVTVTSVPVEERGVSTLSPFETRTVHSTEVCPVCKAVTVKVKTGPLVVALLPLLPAIATMKLPFCGPLIAAAASAPKRELIVMLLTSSNVSS